MRAPKPVKDAIELTAHDIGHHYDLYAGEARHAAKKLEAELRGRRIRYKPLGRPEQDGIIEDVTDRSGSLIIGVVCTPKRGGNGAYKELYTHEIVIIGSKVNDSKAETS